MSAIDLNADLGEAEVEPGLSYEAEILKYVTSANIACGGHAGDDQTMRRTLKLCRDYNINIGAHPAYPDRDGFGRRPWVLGRDIQPGALQKSLLSQMSRLYELALQTGQRVHYVKPHGALYNQAVFDAALAELVAQTIVLLDHNLILMGAPASQLQQAAKRAGLDFIAEGFIDRRYDKMGHLLARTEPGAVIDSDQARIAQALSIFHDQMAHTFQGGAVPVAAQTLCLHSDSPGAAQTARLVRQALMEAGADIKAFR